MSKWKNCKLSESEGVLDVDDVKPDNFPANRALCWKPELAYFDSFPPSQDCFEASEYVRFDPVSAATSNVYDFVLRPAQDRIFDPASIRIGMEVGIVKKGNQELAGALSNTGTGPVSTYDPVALVNCPLTSLFNRVEVLINDVPVNSNCVDQHYRAFIENTFNYPTLAEAYKIAALDAWNRIHH